MPEYKVTLSQTARRTGILIVTASTEGEAIDKAMDLVDSAYWRDYEDEVTDIESVETSVLDGIPEAKPAFEHDCDRCDFLYTARDGKGDVFDVYVDKDQVPFPTVVLRYGSKGYEYESYPWPVLERMPEPKDGDGTPYRIASACWAMRDYRDGKWTLS